LYEKTKIPIRLPRLPAPDRLKLLLPCLVRFGCAFFFTGASLQKHYLPMSLCLLTVPGPGLYGFSAMLGVCCAALLLWNISVAAELIAAAVLIRSAVWIFRDTPPMEHVLFLPLTAALVSALVGGVMLMSDQAQDSFFLFYILF